ncbi:hypothetical protein [Streptomyces sp. R41]|uniref:Uncharacterized protein n=1 Tax=Streptomyces sp. R41 TaxID=3238632 RepID=A0AB39RJ13_9ACTN
MTRAKKALITVAIAVAAAGGASVPAFADSHITVTPNDSHITVTPDDSHITGVAE